MNQAQQIAQIIRNGAAFVDVLASAPIVEWGSFAGITSYWMQDGSRIWRRGNSRVVHVAPAGAPHEKNCRPWPQPLN